MHNNSTDSKQIKNDLFQRAELSIRNIIQKLSQLNVNNSSNNYKFYNINNNDNKNKLCQHKNQSQSTINYQFNFFDKIPNINGLDEHENKIHNLKMNLVSSRRKDQLFKRFKKQQQEIINLKKKNIQKKYYFRYDNNKSWKGQYCLQNSRGKQIIAISHEDIEKLKPQNDLNDSIIGNYLKLLQMKMLPQDIAEKTHIFSSFFLEKLIGDFTKQQPPQEKDMDQFCTVIKNRVFQNYKNVRRWTKKIDIFQKQYIVIPINAFRHWFCLIVVNLNSIDPNNQNSRKPYLVYCDSMFEKKNFIINAIRIYLQLQLNDKKTIELDIKENNLPCYQLLLPRQTNTHDCGLCTLCYIEFLLMKENQLQGLMEIQRRRKLKLFPIEIVFSMRQRLQRMLSGLVGQLGEQSWKQYIEQRMDILNSYTSDFESVNHRQFQKFRQMYKYEQNLKIQSAKEIEYFEEVKFYLDPEINYYEKDKL